MNEELKMALSHDPYFYLNRDDLLVLLKANDIKMMVHLMRTMCKLHLTNDQGYKLIAIKHQQVDKNQMTPIMFLDFLSVMIDNKRTNQFIHDSPIMFSHSVILRFLDEMKEFVDPE